MEKACMVVGAASSIGKQLVYQLINDYSILILTDYKEKMKELELLTKNIKLKHSSIEVLEYQMEVTDVSNIEMVFQKINDNKIELTSLIYLAGYNDIKTAFDVSEEIWDKSYNVNVKGFFFTAQEAAMNMLNHKGGTIVAVSSQHGVIAETDRAPYCSSKAALIHLVKELALEWIKYNIRVNVVSPTFIISDSNRELLLNKRSIKEYLNYIPAKKYLRPEQVCQAIMFLISERAEMVVGHNLIVDGGRSLH